MDKDLLKIKELINEYKKDLQKINNLNSEVNFNAKKIKDTNASSNMKGAYVDVCNQFVESINKSTENIESHLNKAIVQMEKCDEIISNLSRTKEESPMLAASIGIGTGLAIVEGIRKTKVDDKEDEKSEDKKKPNRGVEDGRNKI